MAAHPPEGCRDHPHEPLAVGAQRGDLDVGVEFEVAAAHARRVEVDVHAAQPLDEAQQPCGGVVVEDVDALGDHALGGLGGEGGQRLNVASGGADAPPLPDVKPGDFEADARGGAHDQDAFHGLSFGSYWRCGVQIRCRGGVGG